MKTYRVVRFYQAENRMNTILFTGQSLEQALEWCADPETSSSTCKELINTNHTSIHGFWFDGYEEE